MSAINSTWESIPQTKTCPTPQIVDKFHNRKNSHKRSFLYSINQSPIHTYDATGIHTMPVPVYVLSTVTKYSTVLSDS